MKILPFVMLGVLILLWSFIFYSLHEGIRAFVKRAFLRTLDKMKSRVRKD